MRPNFDFALPYAFLPVSSYIPALCVFLTYLTFIVNLLGHLIFQNLRRLGMLEDLVLSQRKETLEDELCDRESDNHLLPGKQGPVEQTGEALEHVSRVSVEI